jgi:hypothetical protein
MLSQLNFLLQHSLMGSKYLEGWPLFALNGLYDDEEMSNTV